MSSITASSCHVRHVTMRARRSSRDKARTRPPSRLRDLEEAQGAYLLVLWNRRPEEADILTVACPECRFSGVISTRTPATVTCTSRNVSTCMHACLTPSACGKLGGGAGTGGVSIAQVLGKFVTLSLHIFVLAISTQMNRFVSYNLQLQLVLVLSLALHNNRPQT